VRNEQRSDGDQLAAAAEEVEAGRGPVAVSRPGHKLVVLVSAEEWQRLDELESAEATAWWRRDAAERAGSGEEPGEGDEGPGLDEAEFRRRFAHLFHDVGAAWPSVPGRWNLDVRPRAQRQLERLPEKIATAAADFVTPDISHRSDTYGT
jgi:PHD/YefM family antitoxin component YafN of YafNO toxin-antitoxin module